MDAAQAEAIRGAWPKARRVGRASLAAKLGFLGP